MKVVLSEEEMKEAIAQWLRDYKDYNVLAKDVTVYMCHAEIQLEP